MKRRLNILCLIVMLVLGYTVVETGYYFTLGMKAGLEAGIEGANRKASPADKKRMKAFGNIKLVHLMPENFSTQKNGLLQDSVYNQKSKQYVPMNYSAIMTGIETRSSSWSQAVSLLLNLLIAISTVWAILLFARLIISINKSDIFNWKNVRRLRRMGSMLVVSFGCMLLSAYISYHEINAVLAIEGYKLNFIDMLTVTTLLLGLSALIVGEVFAIGLKMQEEQELTI